MAGAKDLQDDYKQLTTKNAKTVGKLLAEFGEAFDKWLLTGLTKTRQAFPNQPEFVVWMAEALVWARYAKGGPAFFEPAIGYLASGDPKLIDEAQQHTDRFDQAKLRDALAAFRRWFVEMEARLSDLPTDAAKWAGLQTRSLTVAQRLKESGEFRQVGLWLFPAPFKLLAIAHPATWADGALDAIVMPNGTQVERALDQLQRDRVVRISRLPPGSNTFADEFANLWNMQDPQKDLAKAGGSNLLHINGALHELGDRRP
jgi:hypothetical protein